jgi:hypothetical protein
MLCPQAGESVPIGERGLSHGADFSVWPLAMSDAVKAYLVVRAARGNGGLLASFYA